MNLIALQMLIGDKLKYVALVIGVAFASLLITQQASIFNGFAKQTGAWVRDTSIADLWVMDEQVEFTEDLKPMQDTLLGRIRGIEGVDWAVPVYKAFFNAVFPDGTRKNVRVIGIDDATLIGGPPMMVQGELADLRQDKGVLMNADMADGPLMLKRGPNGPRPMKVGDRMSFNDNEVVVVGSYRSTKEFFWEPVFYTTWSRARFLYKDQRKGLMYSLVKIKPGYNIAEVQKNINQIKGIQARTNKEFEKISQDWILRETGILVNFGITIVLGVVIGLLVCGQTFYTFVLDNLRHFGALKAMGTTNIVLIRMLCIQTILVAIIGYGIGVGVAAMTGTLLKSGGLAFDMQWQIPLIGASAVAMCCVIAGMLGMVRVVRLEPAIVFKS